MTTAPAIASSASVARSLRQRRPAASGAASGTAVRLSGTLTGGRGKRASLRGLGPRRGRRGGGHHPPGGIEARDRRVVPLDVRLLPELLEVVIEAVALG